MSKYIDRVLEECRQKNAGEPEFLQTVEEVLTSLAPVIDAHPEYEKASPSGADDRARADHRVPCHLAG